MYKEQYVLGDIMKEYLAGYFDAKASISLRPVGQRYQLFITMAHRAFDVLNMFKTGYGGNITPSQGTHLYQITAKKAEGMLTDLLPHLVLKKELAECALDYRTLVGFRSEDVAKEKVDLLNLFNALKEVLYEKS